MIEELSAVREANSVNVIGFDHEPMMIELAHDIDREVKLKHGGSARF